MASQTLTEEYGRGVGLTSIKNMRSFYLMFSKLQIGGVSKVKQCGLKAQCSP